MKHIVRYVLYLFSAFLLVFILTYFSIAKYVAKEAKIDTASKADVIVVLGARSYINGSYNPCLKSRVDQAVVLYKKHVAPKLLMTGGNDTEDNVNEALTMQKIALAQGVPVENILLEKKATSTYENIVFAKNLMQENDLKKSIIVTEPFHMARAGLIAKKQGLDFTVSPASKSPCWLTNKYFSRYFLKEPLAIIVYDIEAKL